MHQHRDIEKEKDTKKYQDFFVAEWEFFPFCKDSVDNEPTHRDTKMNEKIYPDIMAAIYPKSWIFKDGKFWTPKEFWNREKSIRSIPKEGIFDITQNCMNTCFPEEISCDKSFYFLNF